MYLSQITGHEKNGGKTKNRHVSKAVQQVAAELKNDPPA